MTAECGEARDDDATLGAAVERGVTSQVRTAGAISPANMMDRHFHKCTDLNLRLIFANHIIVCFHNACTTMNTYQHCFEKGFLKLSN